MRALPVEPPCLHVHVDMATRPHVHQQHGQAWDRAEAAGTVASEMKCHCWRIAWHPISRSNRTAWSRRFAGIIRVNLASPPLRQGWPAAGKPDRILEPPGTATDSTSSAETRA